MQVDVFWIGGTGNSCAGIAHFWESGERMGGKPFFSSQETLNKLASLLVSVS